MNDLLRRELVFSDQRGLEPLAPLWVTPDDQLVVGLRSVGSGFSVAVEGKLWLPDGSFSEVQFQVAPPNDGLLHFTPQTLDYGYLVSTTVAAIGGTLPRRGQVYATLQVVRPPVPGFRAFKFLGADYLSATVMVAWPFGRIISETEGQGLLVSLALTTPAAGADFSQAVFGNQRWRIRAVRAQLATSAAAGARQPTLQLTDGANVFMVIGQSATQLASLTQLWSWVPGWAAAPVSVPFATAEVMAFLPPDLQLDGNFVLQSRTANLQGGDQWSAIRLLFEEWQSG